MRIFDRYLTHKTLFTTTVSVVFMSFLALSSQVIREADEIFSPDMEGVTLFFSFLLHTLPVILEYMLPWAFLTSALITIKGFSSHNEVTAYRMTGVSYLRIGLPVILIGLACSVGLYFCTGTWTPTAKAKMRTLFSTSQIKDGTVQLTPALFNSLLDREFLVHMDSIDGDTISNLHLYRVEAENAAPSTYTFAKQAVLDFSSPSEVAITLENVYLESHDTDENKTDTLYSDKISPLIIPIKKKRPSDRAHHQTNQTLISTLSSDAVTEQEQQKRFDYFSTFVSRISLSLSCLTFSFLALPMGLQHNRKVSNNGILWGFITAGLFFGALTGLENVGDTMLTRATALLAPNVIGLLLAAWLFRRLKFAS